MLSFFSTTPCTGSWICPKLEAWATSAELIFGSLLTFSTNTVNRTSKTDPSNHHVKKCTRQADYLFILRKTTSKRYTLRFSLAIKRPLFGGLKRSGRSKSTELEIQEKIIQKYLQPPCNEDKRVLLNSTMMHCLCSELRLTCTV